MKLGDEAIALRATKSFASSIASITSLMVDDNLELQSG